MPSDISNWTSLDPRVKRLWQISGLISTAVWTVIALIVDFVLWRNKMAPVPFGVISGANFIFFGVLSQVFISAKYKTTKYRLGEDDLAYAKGIYWKSLRYVSRARIQHVDVESGPIDRYLGLCELKLHVGGAGDTSMEIPGLAEEEGQRIRKVLMDSSWIKQREALPTEAEEPAAP